MKKAAILITLAALLPALLGAKGCSVSSSGAGQGSTSPAGASPAYSVSAPSKKQGHCQMASSITRDVISGEVEGLLTINCTGAGSAVVNVNLEWFDPRLNDWDILDTIREFPSGQGMATLTAPCHVGLWRLAITCLLYTSPSPRD